LLQTEQWGTSQIVNVIDDRIESEFSIICFNQILRENFRWLIFWLSFNIPSPKALVQNILSVYEWVPMNDNTVLTIDDVIIVQREDFTYSFIAHVQYNLKQWWSGET